MKKLILFTASIFTIGFSANAQQSAQQTIQLDLSNALEITFTSNGTTTGPTVTLPFTTVNDYASGVQSAAQQLKVRSNKAFNVAVKGNTAFFATGGGASTMPVSALQVKVFANSTGGSIAGTYAGYTDLSTAAANVITNGTYGGNQLFSVMYNANPGFAYPAGTYTMDVVYTATQQ
jgi:hypothetical protein